MLLSANWSGAQQGSRYPHIHTEREYQTEWCTRHNGIAEYKLPDNTRVDCLTENWAVEFDFAPKWAECIGQAQHYATMTKRVPVCGLIMEYPERDERYLKHLRRTVYNRDLIKEFKTFTLKPKYLEK